MSRELHDAREECEQLLVAMKHRTVIGQAEGILMERLGIDADQAFAYLRRMSQCENRKLITVCNDIIETRQLPQYEPTLDQRPRPARSTRR